MTPRVPDAAMLLAGTLFAAAAQHMHETRAHASSVVAKSCSSCATSVAGTTSYRHSLGSTASSSCLCPLLPVMRTSPAGPQSKLVHTLQLSSSQSQGLDVCYNPGSPSALVTSLYTPVCTAHAHCECAFTASSIASTPAKRLTSAFGRCALT